MSEHWYAIDAAIWAMTAMFAGMAFELFCAGTARILKFKIAGDIIKQLPKLTEAIKVEIKKEVD